MSLYGISDSAAAPYLEFGDSTEAAKRPIDHHPYLRCRQWREGKLAPDLVVV